jgi:hypothetical protein
VIDSTAGDRTDWDGRTFARSRQPLARLIDKPGTGSMPKPQRLITHKNTKVKGHRKSVVAFTQANMFEYWSCILLDVNVPWDGWSRIYSDGEKKTVGSSRAKVKKDPRECWRPKAKIMPGPCATRSGARY